MCRPQKLQTAGFADLKFRHDRLMLQQKHLLDLESSPELQSEAILERPIYNEDILSLAIQDPSFCKHICSAVPLANQTETIL